MNKIDFTKALELITKLVSEEKSGKIEEDLSEIKTIIYERLQDELEDKAPHNFAQLLFDMQYYYERLKDNILFRPLIGRNVVALGGGFSSGKSSFLNALFGKRVLPAGITPTTSVPTYVVKSSKTSANAINIFNSIVPLKIEDLKIISHGFSEEFDVKFGHLLRTLFLELPENPFGKIAFLDTPGYSKADDENFSEKTDENIARAQLNSSNFILWFVPVVNGTITEDDLNFLGGLDKKIPKAVIISKADAKTESEIIEVRRQVENLLNTRGLEVEAVIPFSARYPQRFDGYANVKKTLDAWQKKRFRPTFGYDFMKLFVETEGFYDEIIFDETKRLEWLNKGALYLEEDNEEIEEVFNKLLKEIKYNVTSYKKRREELKKLKKEFFEELDKINDKYQMGIVIPSETEVYENNLSELLPLIRSLKKKRGIKPGNFKAVMGDKFNEVNVQIINARGYFKYREFTAKRINQKLNASSINLLANEDRIKDTAERLGDKLSQYLEFARKNSVRRRTRLFMNYITKSYDERVSEQKK